MMSGYTKLFGSIVASTIWSEDDQTRIIWITMLAMKNQHGEVEASIPGLAKFAHVSIESTEKALAKLMAPDQYSRTKEFEGRRIEEIDGGWLVLKIKPVRMMNVKKQDFGFNDFEREMAKIP
jgi:CTP-dependent riboflavin kinase